MLPLQHDHVAAHTVLLMRLISSGAQLFLLAQLDFSRPARPHLRMSEQAAEEHF